MKTLRKGTYCLILKLETRQKMLIGKLGCLEFPEGFYVYVGSAFGPGGLTARLKHHLRPAIRPHWHIDYFRQRAVVVGIHAEESEISLEHRWASILERKTASIIPVPKFGASDCKCSSHLFYFQKMPDLQEFGKAVTVNNLNILKHADREIILSHKIHQTKTNVNKSLIHRRKALNYIMCCRKI